MTVARAGFQGKTGHGSRCDDAMGRRDEEHIQPPQGIMDMDHGGNGNRGACCRMLFGDRDLHVQMLVRFTEDDARAFIMMQTLIQGGTLACYFERQD